MRDFNKIAGCLIGGAAGDALGYAVEFEDESEIFKTYGEGGIRQYALSGGKAVISDDTQMTLFTAEGILAAKDPYDYTEYILGMYDAYQSWLKTQQFSNKKTKKAFWLNDIPELNKRRAPGNTCLMALRSHGMGCIDEPINNSKGCGGVMRVAPIGLYYSPDRQSLQKTDMWGAQAAALTHGHPLGYIPAAGLVHIVNLAMYKSEMMLKEIVDDMIREVTELFMEAAPGYSRNFQELMEKAVRLAVEQTDVDDLTAIHELGEGWVAEETLAIAIYCSLRHADDFDAALIAAVNHKGDSDSTGAVTGNILGAYLGLEKIPKKYTENLELVDVLEKVARELEKGK